MGQHLRETLPAEIQETRARLDAWRETRRSGTPIPADLWCEAVEWARRFGVNPICRALGLSFTDLRKRVEHVHQVRVVPRAAEPTFVELSLDPEARMRASGDRGGFQAGIHGGPVVEVVSPNGARMVMRWPLGAAVDAGELVASFLGRGR